MALISKQKKHFTLKIKDSREHGENIVFIKGGSIILEDKWVFFPDLRIDVQATILSYASETSRRIFNNFNDSMYVLIVLNKTGQIEVIPSVSYNKNALGDVKVFPSLAGKLPLILTRLTQDGSTDLKSFIPILPGDVELYQGYGNFTTKGPKGEEGFKGITGLVGITGMAGIQGIFGMTGMQGYTGALGVTLCGITGSQGIDGVSIPAFMRGGFGVIVERGSFFDDGIIIEDDHLPDTITEN